MAVRGGSPVTTNSKEYSTKKCSLNNCGNEPTDIGSEIVAESHDGVSWIYHPVTLSVILSAEQEKRVSLTYRHRRPHRVAGVSRFIGQEQVNISLISLLTRTPLVVAVFPQHVVLSRLSYPSPCTRPLESESE